MHKKVAPFQRLAGFFRRDEASISVEAVLVLPFLLWAFAAMFSFFDVYHARSLAMKGNYAVADLLSRETNAIDMNYLRGTEDIYQYITRSDTTSWVRVTPVRCRRYCNNPVKRQLRRDWSRATDGKHRLTNTDINDNYRDVVPLISRGERVIMVETIMEYTPPLNPKLTGVFSREIKDLTMTRPRFGPQLCWVGRYCGNT